MRKLVLWLLMLMPGGVVYSQVTADIGLWGGASGTLGDLRGNTLFPTTFPTLGAYFRYNFNQRTSARLMFLSGKAAGEGTILGQPWAFDKAVQDLSLQVEINYLKYMLGNKKSSFTSYLTAGGGVMYYNYEPRVGGTTPEETGIGNINPSHPDAGIGSTQSVITPTLPFGIGVKFNMGKRVGLGVEYQMRKLFNDGLDDLDDPMGSVVRDPADPTKITQTSSFTDQLHNNDWIGFLGVHLTFKVYMGSKPCPAYDSKY